MSKSFIRKLRCFKILIFVFLNILLMYSMILCLYISSENTLDVIEANKLVSYCVLILENIICSLTITVICVAFYLYNINKYLHNK